MERDFFGLTYKDTNPIGERFSPVMTIRTSVGKVMFLLLIYCLDWS